MNEEQRLARDPSSSDDGKGKPAAGQQATSFTPDQKFWQLWRQGRPPELAAFLSEQRDLTPEQAAAVIAIDQYERWLAGERIAAEHYLQLLPRNGLAADAAQATCDIVYGEYLLREQLGEGPTLGEFQQRFPDQASKLARQIELHHALADDTAPSLGSQRTLRPRSSLASGIVQGKEAAIRPEIPGYQILDEIGRGGMGVVYKARQVSLDRLIALKVVRVEADSDPAALDRMRREARMTGSLSHPNIVAVHDAGLVGDQFYLAMEFVPGIDLHRLVETRGPLAVPLACSYLRQAALGLQHAHEQGLVHRDIKPSNLIVLEPGKGQVKVLDLGLARLLPVPRGQTRTEQQPLTEAGAFMGTPDFIAPEQASDPRQADARSDLYSLGCTLYYMLTGKPPFAEGTPLAKLMAHHTETPPAIPALAPEVAAILSRLLAKRPQDRYQNAAELARDLRPCALADPLDPLDERPVQTVVTVAAGTRREESWPGNPLCRLQGHSEWVKGIAFSPDGQHLASVGLDRTVRLWGVQTGEERWCVQAHGKGALCVGFTPGGGELITGGQDGTLCCWEPYTGRRRWQAVGHSDNVNCLAFSQDGKVVLSGGHDGTLRLRSCEQGREVRMWTAHTGPVWSIAMGREGRMVLSGGQDRGLRLWDTQTGESLAGLPEQPMLVTCLALSPDGKQALTGGLDGVLYLWDLLTLGKPARLEGHDGRLTSVTFSPDGRLALSGSRDNTARVWDLATGKLVQTLRGHGRWVTGVAWSGDGTRLATCSADRSVCVWAAG